MAGQSSPARFNYGFVVFVCVCVCAEVGSRNALELCAVVRCRNVE